jgi:hypothetical protein
MNVKYKAESRWKALTTISYYTDTIRARLKLCFA